MNFPDLTSAIKNNARVSMDKALKIQAELYEKVIGPHMAKFEKELYDKFHKREEELLEQIKKLENEPLRDMIERIAAKTVESQVREKLSVCRYRDWDGYDRTTLSWDGEEF